VLLIVAIAAAFGVAAAVNSRSLAFLWTDEVGSPFPEPLLSFWTWRLPLGVGLGLILLAALAALRPPICIGHVALVIAVALLAGTVFVWWLRAAATHLPMRTVASTLAIEPVPTPPPLLEFFSDHDDAAGIATEDPAAVARYVGCYEWRLPRYRAWEHLRLTAEPTRADWDVPHPLLRVEEFGLGGFWYVERDTAVVIWKGETVVRSMRIRKMGDRYHGVHGMGDEVETIAWHPIELHRARCPAPRAQAPPAQPAAPTPLKATTAEIWRTGTGMSSWFVDNVDGANLQAFTKHESVHWSSCPAISLAELRSLLVPQYLQKVPEKDSWGNPYEFCLRRNSFSTSGSRWASAVPVKTASSTMPTISLVSSIPRTLPTTSSG